MTVTEIENIIRTALDTQLVLVEDESALHRGHAGSTGGGHYRVLIVAQGFAGLRYLERHRKVYSLFSEHIGRDVHALSLKTLTPEEYRNQSDATV